MTKKVKVDRELIKAIASKNVSAVDPDNKIIYLKRDDKDIKLKFMKIGYKVNTIGEIHFVSQYGAQYAMPYGCSPVHAESETTATTALHCVSTMNMVPKKNVTLVVIDSTPAKIGKIDASLENYTAIKRCGLWCRLLMFFQIVPEGYINYREIAWLKADENISRYEPLPGLETLGHLTAGNDAGDYMMFSPFPNKEDEIQPGTPIIYISFDYYENKLAVLTTTITGYSFANIDGYLFYLPYAYEPGKKIAIPGFSGSAIKKGTLYTAQLAPTETNIKAEVGIRNG
jgi:hypothetical protein